MRIRFQLISLLWCVLLAAPSAVGEEGAPFVAQALDDGVWLFRPVEENGSRTNALVVDGHRGLTVIDAQPSPDAARELLAAIRETTDKPVRFLIYTHAHLSAVGGSSVFPESVVRLASKPTHAALSNPRYDWAGEARERGRGSQQAPGPGPARVLPDVVISAPTVLADPEHPLTLGLFRHAHSPGDLTVAVGNILAVGDLVVADRNLYARDADAPAWLGALNQIVRAGPEIIVPLRGPAMKLEQVMALRTALAWIEGQVVSAFIDRAPRDEILPGIRAHADFATYFDPQPDPDFLPDLVDRFVAAEIDKRRKRGMLD